MAWPALALLSAGLFFLLVGSIGLLRLPDFYCRMHAATKPDTMGLILAMLGLALHEGVSPTSAKMLLIILFVAIANPAANHALAASALRAGLQPWVRPKGGDS
jgi:multicomponent Na+:H+ antiporter subunit G